MTWQWTSTCLSVHWRHTGETPGRSLDVGLCMVFSGRTHFSFVVFPLDFSGVCFFNCLPWIHRVRAQGSTVHSCWFILLGLSHGACSIQLTFHLPLCLQWVNSTQTVLQRQRTVRLSGLWTAMSPGLLTAGSGLYPAVLSVSWLSMRRCFTMYQEARIWAWLWVSYDEIEMRHEGGPARMCWCLGLAPESVLCAYR